jgi:hypothetical protein
MPDKSRIGASILEQLLNYGKIIERRGLHKLKIGKNIIRVLYNSLDFTRMYAPDKCFAYEYVNPERSRINFSNHKLYVYFRGKLDFYKDFSMYYIFVDNDDGTQRLRSISERQYHREDFSYWTTTYGIPFTEERIHSMLYDAINIAFDYKNDENKFNNLIQKIHMATIREV